MKKHPFELNDANNYLWQRQGKRHYWGIKGKDYGLLESALNHRPQVDGDMQILKYKHVSLHQNPYEQRMSHEKPEERPRVQHQERQFLEEPFDYRKPYASQKPAALFKIKTEPVEYQEEPNRQGLNSGEGKRKQLSLMSKNIQISNRETPKVAVMDRSKRFSTLDYADEKQRQMEEAIKKTHRRVATESAIHDNELEKYRERIIRVVRKDRKNNPTFCNSLAYPLHCYRYVQ